MNRRIPPELSHLTWGKLKDMKFIPMPRTPEDESAFVYRYIGPDGLVVTLGTGTRFKP